MIDPVEIINRFTEYNPSKGELPLPLPIPGHWFRKICALADRIAKAENELAAMRKQAQHFADIATVSKEVDKIHANIWANCDGLPNTPHPPISTKIGESCPACTAINALRELLNRIDRSTYGIDGIHNLPCAAPDHGPCTCGAYKAYEDADQLLTNWTGDSQ